MQRTGRPLKTDAERRTEVLQIRLTQSEYAAIKEAAAKDSRTMADYTRLAVLRQIKD